MNGWTDLQMDRQTRGWNIQPADRRTDPQMDYGPADG